MSAKLALQRSLDESLPLFQRQQYAFTAHIRDPEQHACPSGVSHQRMMVYRELLFNNVNSFLKSGFPVCRSILDEVTWNTLVRHFFSQHQCHSPYFTDISTEFLHYLSTEKPDDLLSTYPFFSELAHYEWMELVALIAKEELPARIMTEMTEDLRIMLSPLAYPLSYNYPVHRIGPTFVPSITEATTLVVFRNRQDEIEFMQLSGLSYVMLQSISATPLTISELTALLLPEAQRVQAGMSKIRLQALLLPVIADFERRDIVLSL